MSLSNEQHALDAALRYHERDTERPSPARVAATARKFYDVLVHPVREPVSKKTSDGED